MKTKILLTALLLLSSLSNWAQLPSYLPANGLVAWYPFNGNANDESGNGNNGTNNGASLTEDRFGNANSAYYFSSAGCGTRIDANVNTSSIQTGLTISVWLKRVGNGCISPRILEFWPGSNGPGMAQWGWAYGYPGEPNRIGLGSLTSTGYSCAEAILEPSLTDWIQIAYTNDGSNGRFYYNGTLVSTLPSEGNPILASNLAIGRMNHPAYDAFNGNMDDLGVWNRALSEAEISNLFNSNSTPCTANSSTVNATITEGATYSFNGQNLTTTGTYTATLQNTAGCDSVVTLNLVVNTPAINCEISAASYNICSGESIELSVTNSGNPNTVSNYSLDFPNTGQYSGNSVATCSSNLGGFDLTDDFTVEFWINAESSYYWHLMGKNTFGDNSSGWLIKKPSNQMLLGWTYVPNEFDFHDFTYNEWEHIAISFNDATNKFSYFKNGQLISEQTRDININAAPYDFVIGHELGTGNWFDGKIDNLRISNVVRYATNFNPSETFVNDASVVAMYDFNEGSGNIANDLSGNNRHLNLSNTLYSTDVPNGSNAVNENVTWSNGETTPTISVSPTATTTYSVTVTQGNQTCTSEVTITVNQPSAETVNASITEGESYNFNGQNLTAAGTYTATLQNAAGCDSMVTLNLTVEPAVEPLNCEITASDSEVCNGENLTLSMEVSGQISTQLLTSNDFNVVGTYNGKTYLVTNAAMTWNDAKVYSENLGYQGATLAVFETLEENNAVDALTNQYNEWLWFGLFQDLSSPQYSEPLGGWSWVNGAQLTYSNWENGEPNNLGGENFAHLKRYPNGKWNDHFAEVQSKAIIEINEIQSVSYLWSNGETTQSINVVPTETTTYSCVYTSGNQTCTSEVTITVNQPNAETVNATITEGESYNFNGQNLTTAGTYTATLQNAAGCDSVVTLNLTVNPAPVAGCYATSVVNLSQGLNAIGNAVAAIRSNAELALGMPEPVVTNVVNFVSLGFGGSITLAFEAPIANGDGNDIRIDEATWNNNPCNRYPERADVFASQDGVNFVYLGVACQDASFDLGALSWAQYVRIVDISDILSFNADADGFDVNGIECLNGAATSLNNDGLVACSLQEIVSYTPGNRKNGTAVGSPRNNPANALGTPQNNNTINFTALGFGGTMVAKFDYVVFNQPGNDLRVTETSFGNPSCNNYPEKARVSVSMDNLNWIELGEICQDGEIDLANVNYAQYIKIQDASPLSSNKFNGAADGYDVDAVVVLNNGCGTSSARLAQMDNTTTPDASLMISAFPNPMEDYTIVNFEGLENDSDFNFQIMDAAGRVIRNQNIRVTASNPTYLFDASELARGIYQVIIANENGSNIIRLVK
jgi:hypothetical protein